jgi:hypothetical protein
MLQGHVSYIYSCYLRERGIMKGFPSFQQKNKITCLTKDKDNRYFATGDVGHESLVIIWDIKTGYPFKKISASFEDYGIIAIGFVGSEDYIGTIGIEKVKEDETEGKELQLEERQVINIWFFGNHMSKAYRKHHHIPSGKPTGKSYSYYVVVYI